MKAFALALTISIGVFPQARGQSLTRVGAMSPLIEIPLAYPRSISPDGSVIVGWEQIVGGDYSQFSWTEADGFTELDFDEVYLWSPPTRESIWAMITASRFV